MQVKFMCNILGLLEAHDLVGLMQLDVSSKVVMCMA